MIIKEQYQDDNRILNILRDYVNVSRKPMLGSAYLTRQGEFINLGESVDSSHGDIISYLENEDITMFEDSWEFSEAFGYIRLNSGLNDDNAAYVEFLDNTPTEEQYEQLENWMYFIMNRKVRHIEVNVDSGNQQHVYYFVNDLPEEIIKKIKRYYSSGNLYESSSDELPLFDYTDEPLPRTFISTDGKFVDLKGMNHNTTNKTLGNYKHNSKLTLVNKYNFIRCSKIMTPSIELPPKNLTSYQYDSLLLWIDTNMTDKLIVDTSDGKHQFYQDYLSDDIIKKIKRFYTSGKLYEDTLTTNNSRDKTYYLSDNEKSYLNSQINRNSLYKNYRIEVVPIKDIVNKIMSDNSVLGRRQNVWGNNYNNYKLNDKKLEYSVMSEPIRLSKDANGNYHVKDGNHRLVALYNDGYTAVECLVKIDTDLKESTQTNDKNKKLTLYHLSKDKNLGELIPRIPKSEYEEQETPRVCFSNSVQGALIGINEDKDITGEEFYVYTIETDNYYQPTEDEVADVNITDEVWILEPITPTLHSKIRVDGIYDYETHTLLGDEVDVPIWDVTTIELEKDLDEKWEIAEFHEDSSDYVDADVFVSDDVRDIVREINKEHHWEQYKFILDDNKELYIKLDPFYIIHDDAFYVTVQNGWYPELNKSNWTSYVSEQGIKGKLHYIMVTFGVDEKGMPKDIGQDYFDFAYMYPKFNILVRKGKSFEKSELYKLLGKEDKIVDISDTELFLEDANVDVEKDNEGNQLSEEQLQYFRNTKVRDEKGNLLVCYHSTNGVFNAFSSDESWDNFGFHFGTKKAAEDVGGSRIIKAYLNITNPLIVDEDFQYWDAFSFIRYFYEHPEVVKDFNIEGWDYIVETYEKDLEWEEGMDTSYYNSEFGDDIRKALYNSKYDGVFYTNWGEDAGSTSYMCFYPEQIKYIDNKQPTKSKKMNEDTDVGELSNQDIKEIFLDEWHKLYDSSTEHILSLLDCKTQSELDVESPMFVLPDGEIISIQKVLMKNGFDEERTHHALAILISYKVMSNIISDNNLDIDADSFIYEHENFFDRYTREFLDVLTYKFDWVRLNCGTRYVETRFYCVLPNSVTSYQYKVLDDWLWWGEQNNKDKVLIFCSSYQDNNTYKFSENTAEDIIKKIKRYYTSGKLYESIVLYRGEGDNNYSVKNNSQIAGLFFAVDQNDAGNFSDSVYQYELKDGAKIYKGESSLDYCKENNLMDKKDRDLQKMLGVNTLLDMFEDTYGNGALYPKDEFLDDRTFAGTQLMAKKDLEKKGYDGAYWSYEDDLTPHQYQIWNTSVVSKYELNEDYGDEDEYEMTFWEQVEKDEQDMLDLFYTMSSDDFLNYLDIPIDDKLDKNSAMYILPNGDIVSVSKALQQYDIDLAPYHVNLFLCFAKKYFTEETEGRYTQNQIDEILIQMEQEETFTSLSDIMVEITYGLGWARVNCGKTWTEDRFYCVLPNKMTNYQFYTLEDWLIWGEQNKVKNNQVIVFVDNAQTSKTYDYNKSDADDIIKSIRRYYSSGNLYEDINDEDDHIDSGEIWYHGTSYSKRITEFNQPINWFTTDLKYAMSYALMFTQVGKGTIYRATLSNKKALDCGETSHRLYVGLSEFSSHFKQIIEKLGVSDERIEQLIEDVTKEQASTSKNYRYKIAIDVVTRTKAFRNLCVECGYDSIITYEKGIRCCGIFNPKNIEITGIKKV